MSNLDIRGEIRAAGLTQWQVAEAMEISESVLCRKLRHELPEEEKDKIRSIIKELAKNKDSPAQCRRKHAEESPHTGNPLKLPVCSIPHIGGKIQWQLQE